MLTCAAVPSRCSAVSPSSGTLFDFAGKQKQLDELTAKMGAPGFWDTQEKAQAVVALTKPLTAVLKPYEALASDADELRATAELAEEDESFEAELEPLLAKVEKQI